MTDKANTDMEKIDIVRDVLVIGGGLVGLQTAKAIAERGYPVVLTEAGDKAGIDAESLPLTGTDSEQLSTLTEQAAASGIEILNNTQLAGAAGMPGDFKVWLAEKEGVAEKQVAQGRGAVGRPRGRSGSRPGGDQDGSRRHSDSLLRL